MLIESETRADYVHKMIHSMIEAIQREAESEVNLERGREIYQRVSYTTKAQHKRKLVAIL